MKNKFSVIIPTLFKCQSILNELLQSLYEDDAVSEVILIDNTVFEDPIPTIKFNSKMTMYSAGKNLFVNPSWNYGVSFAKEEYIAILNDDITIPNNLFTVLGKADLKQIGVIGACHPMIQEVKSPKRFNIQKAELVPVLERRWGYGILMVMHKDHYYNIPEEMKVWCGDDYLFHQNRNEGRQNYTLVCPIQTKMSTTSNDPAFDKIKHDDLEIYNLKYRIEMTLLELYLEQGAKTDKGTVHDYIAAYYSKEFSDKRDKNIKLMEIGVHRGPSIILWKAWFKNSEIVGVDNENIYEGAPVYDKLYIEDAYADEFISRFDDGYFDYIIDDGPHTLESQIISATKWIHKIKPGGKLIIEDIQSPDWIGAIESNLDKSIVRECSVFDLRENKKRYDDIIFEITKK